MLRILGLSFFTTLSLFACDIRYGEIIQDFLNDRESKFLSKQTVLYHYGNHVPSADILADNYLPINDSLYSAKENSLKQNLIKDPQLFFSTLLGSHREVLDCQSLKFISENDEVFTSNSFINNGDSNYYDGYVYLNYGNSDEKGNFIAQNFSLSHRLTCKVNFVPGIESQLFIRTCLKAYVKGHTFDSRYFYFSDIFLFSKKERLENDDLLNLIKSEHERLWFKSSLKYQELVEDLKNFEIKEKTLLAL